MSTMTLNEAWEVLVEAFKSNKLNQWATGFFTSVDRQASHRGGVHMLSPKQQAVILKLAGEVKTPPKALPTIRCQSLTGIFDQAAEKLRYPKITFQFILTPDIRDRNVAKYGAELRDLDKLTKKQAELMIRLYANETVIRLQRAGDRARYPGSINVTSTGYDKKWYGRILQNGEFQMSPACTDDVREFIVAFSKSPEKISAWFGRNSGNCCYCNKWLTDERSLEVGYGPACAENYGQPWGKKARVR